MIILVAVGIRSATCLTPIAEEVMVEHGYALEEELKDLMYEHPAVGIYEADWILPGTRDVNDSGALVLELPVRSLYCDGPYEEWKWVT